MNMFGLTPEFIPMLEDGFCEFFKNSVPENPLKAEFLVPVYIGKLLEDKKISVKVIPTSDKWFGVTYKEDKQVVVDALADLISKGAYANL